MKGLIERASRLNRDLVEQGKEAKKLLEDIKRIEEKKWTT